MATPSGRIRNQSRDLADILNPSSRRLFAPVKMFLIFYALSLQIVSVFCARYSDSCEKSADNYDIMNLTIVRIHDRPLQVLTLAGDGEKWLTSVQSLQPFYLQHRCRKNVAVYINHRIYLSLDNFITPVEPLKISSEILQNTPVVSSVAFLQENLLIVFEDRVFIHNIYDKSPSAYILCKGITQEVTNVFARPCCHKLYHLCAKSNKLTVAWKPGSRSFFISNDGGYTFKEDTVTNILGNGFAYSDTYDLLSAIYPFQEGGDSWFRTQTYQTDYASNVPLFDGLPIQHHENYSFYITEMEGFGTYIVSHDKLYYSTFHGKTFFPVKCWNCAPTKEVLMAPSETIRYFVSDYRGKLAIITTENNFYYGTDGLPVNVVKLPSSLITPFSVVTFASTYGQMHVWTPKDTSQDLNTKLWLLREGVIIQNVMLDVYPHKCSVRYIASNLTKNREYLCDRTDTFAFEVLFVPEQEHEHSFRLLVGLTNPLFYATTYHIPSQQKHLSNGLKLKTMTTVVRMSQLLLNNDSEYFSGLSSGGKTNIRVTPLDSKPNFMCNNDIYNAATLVAMCPPSKNIRIRRQHIQDETCYDRKDHSYDIQKKYIDKSFQRESPTTVSNDVVKFPYDYVNLGCPIRTYYVETFKPVIDIYMGNTFVKELDADFVMYEVNGVMAYTYNTTVKQAGCKRKSQTWKEQLATDPIPRTAWTKFNYRSCLEEPVNSDEDISVQDPSTEYEILNKHTRNGLLWESLNYIFVFQVTVVDRNISYCNLSTKFAVEVYGAAPKSDIPTLIIVGAGTAVMLILFYISFLLKLNDERQIRGKDQILDRMKKVQYAVDEYYTGKYGSDFVMPSYSRMESMDIHPSEHG